jgi:hypothetical protein
MVYQVPGMPGQRSVEAEPSIHRTNFGDFRNHISIPGCLHRMQVIPACRAWRLTLLLPGNVHVHPTAYLGSSDAGTIFGIISC